MSEEGRGGAGKKRAERERKVSGMQGVQLEQRWGWVGGSLVADEQKEHLLLGEKALTDNRLLPTSH